MKTYYDVLEIKQTASFDEIKTAYKRMAKRFHPDVNKETNAHDKMQMVNKAFNTLTTDRAGYDRRVAAASGTPVQRGQQWGSSDFANAVKNYQASSPFFNPRTRGVRIVTINGTTTVFYY